VCTFERLVQVAVVRLVLARLAKHYMVLDQGFSTGVSRNPRVPRDVARGSARDRD
jgi:hypothetical protein